MSRAHTYISIMKSGANGKRKEWRSNTGTLKIETWTELPSDISERRTWRFHQSDGWYSSQLWTSWPLVTSDTCCFEKYQFIPFRTEHQLWKTSIFPLNTISQKLLGINGKFSEKLQNSNLLSDYVWFDVSWWSLCSNEKLFSVLGGCLPVVVMPHFLPLIYGFMLCSLVVLERTIQMCDLDILYGHVDYLVLLPSWAFHHLATGWLVWSRCTLLKRNSTGLPNAHTGHFTCFFEGGLQFNKREYMLA